MKAEENPDNQEATPSPYQDADVDVEVTEIHYLSPAKGEGIFLGKTTRKITLDGKISYTLTDPQGRILGPDLPDEETVRQVWGVIAQAVECSEALKKLRTKDDKDQDKDIER